jgi:Zn-dependent M28 family amino/carboxypeptidase
MVGAHYDSTSTNPNYAPGVTDNGGGCAIVLELARIMSQYSFRSTVKFAFWNREEDGCLGSADYVDNAMPANLTLYFNYDSAVLDRATMLDIMYDDQSVADIVTQQNNLYHIGLQLNYNGHYGHGVTCRSDYMPFKDVGKTWVMTHVQVTAGTPTPDNAADHAYQHTPDDTVDKISVAFAKKNAQLGMSTIAKLAEDQHSFSQISKFPPFLIPAVLIVGTSMATLSLVIVSRRKRSRVTERL